LLCQPGKHHHTLKATSQWRKRCLDVSLLPINKTQFVDVFCWITWRIAKLYLVGIRSKRSFQEKAITLKELEFSTSYQKLYLPLPPLLFSRTNNISNKTYAVFTENPPLVWGLQNHLSSLFTQRKLAKSSIRLSSKDLSHPNQISFYTK